MDREFYTDLAASGLRMPFGTDLVLHDKGDREAIKRDGVRLGQVVAEAANRYRTPLAFPLMDLTVEKHALVTSLGVSDDDAPTYHLDGALSADQYDRLLDGAARVHTVRMQATCDAITYVAENTDLVPIGMSIGPFSFMTKLIAEPISAIYMAGTGVTAWEDDDVKLVEQCLALAQAVISRNLTLQIEAGAKAVFICEPAASNAYLSPRQIYKGSDVFDRYALAPNMRIARLLHDAGVDLIFHNCGELTDHMVHKFADLDPAIMSLGSSRCLWEDAKLVPKSTVLYGNLPTKKFYSDSEVPIDAVRSMTRELVANMRQAEHPHILGSECDILAVPGALNTIVDKTNAFLTEKA
jgi:uroporphyrinogen-III decarboxylase